MIRIKMEIGLFSLLTMLLSIVGSGQGLRISYVPQWGISELSYKGNELVNLNKQLGGPITLEAYKYINSKKESFNVWSFVGTHGYTEKTNEYVAKCSWGTMACKYIMKEDTLFLKLTYTNEMKEDTFCGVSVCPLTLQLGKRPAGFQPLFPYVSNGSVSAPLVYADMGDYGISVETINDKRKSYVGLIEESNSNGTRYRLWASNYPFIGMAAFDPRSELHLAPGQSYTVTVAVKFLKKGTSLEKSSQLTLAKYRSENVFSLDWKDRRPIGMLFLSSYVDKKDSVNPRHWQPGNNSFSFSTQQGRAFFKSEVLAFADRSITILKRMNAQAMITWDIEGQQFPHPWSYIGSPDLINRLAPEMNEIADEYFKKFLKAGFRTGICIRPDSVTINKDASWIEHQAVKNPVATMIRKIKYAQKRWGCRVFYIDSNIDAAGSLMNADYFKIVHQACPDVLLIPEHENVQYYSSTAPYGEFRANEFMISDEVKTTYPNAFMSLVVPEGLPPGKSMEEHVKLLRNSAAQGNIFLFRAWYQDPTNELIRKSYEK